MREQSGAARTMGTSAAPWAIFFLVLAAACSLAVFWKRALPSFGEGLWLATFAVQAMIRMPHSVANRQNKIRERRHGATERLALPLMFLTMMVLPLVSIATPLLAFADYAAPLWTVWTGAGLSMGFLWLFWRSHDDLGRNWSPGLEVRENHALVTRGVYRFIRHPMYAAIWLAALAQPLLIHNWVSGPAVIAAFLFMCVTRLPREEAMMHDQFGDAYSTYSLRTKRLIPGVF
jgi:protein-S-isoprenylcysteine O-methyltransferase Ste14